MLALFKEITAHREMKQKEKLKAGTHGAWPNRWIEAAGSSRLLQRVCLLMS